MSKPSQPDRIVHFSNYKIVIWQDSTGALLLQHCTDNNSSNKKNFKKLFRFKFPSKWKWLQSLTRTSLKLIQWLYNEVWVYSFPLF